MDATDMAGVSLGRRVGLTRKATLMAMARLADAIAGGQAPEDMIGALLDAKDAQNARLAIHDASAWVRTNEVRGQDRMMTAACAIAEGTLADWEYRADEARAARNRTSRERYAVMSGLGLRRTRSGSWE